MRVIAGKFRSRPLRSLRGLDIRPTSDRLRETLFDVLIAGNPVALEGSVWVDLFAGTGAVGIEALSRGAAMVHFAESSKRAAGIIQANLQSLGIKEGFEILPKDSIRVIADLERRSVRADYIFLDPPYAMREAYEQTLSRLDHSASAKAAIIIAEHEKRFDPGERFGTLKRFRQLSQGDAVLSFYRPTSAT
jgi:16S rRNA (guanine(966)-N(2))-methyltransferase RsmD